MHRHDTTERTDLEIFESLRYEYTPPCDFPIHESGRMGHAGSAFALIRVRCPGCSTPPIDAYLCKGAWEMTGSMPFKCQVCGYPGPRGAFWTILAYVNGS